MKKFFSHSPADILLIAFILFILIGCGGGSGGTGGVIVTYSLVGDWAVVSSSGNDVPDQMTFNVDGRGNYTGTLTGSSTFTWSVSGDALTFTPLGGQTSTPILSWTDNNNVRITSTSNGTVANMRRRSTTTYQFSKAWGSAGAGDGQFNFAGGSSIAAGIAVDVSGNVYVADWANHRIQKFDSNGNFLAKWGSQGNGDGQFRWPIGIAIAPNGDVLVTEASNCRVQRFTATGAFVAKWGSQGVGDGQFQNPNGITVTPAGTIYVADTFNNRIQRFDSNGNFVAKWGSQGTGDGQFRLVYNVVVSSTGRVYATDNGNGRVQIFDANGAFLGKFDAPDTMTPIRPIGLDFDGDGNLFVADIAFNRIIEYDPANVFVRQWGSGLPGTGNGEFAGPYAVAVDANASVFVADTNNNRIQKFIRVP